MSIITKRKVKAVSKALSTSDLTSLVGGSVAQIEQGGKQWAVEVELWTDQTRLYFVDRGTWWRVLPDSIRPAAVNLELESSTPALVVASYIADELMFLARKAVNPLPNESRPLIALSEEERGSAKALLQACSDFISSLRNRASAEQTDQEKWAAARMEALESELSIYKGVNG